MEDVKITSVNEAIDMLRNSPYVKEKDLGNGISSFNFTNKAFWRKHWDNLTVTARGLFIDVKNRRVKARSYDKFFAIGEFDSIDDVARKAEFPIDVYVKENGYLGICAGNEDGTLWCASKSTDKGWYAARFEDLLREALGRKVEKFANRLYQNNICAVFEVIDPIEDGHIIEYEDAHVVLLELVMLDDEDIDFWEKSYEILKVWEAIFDLPIKQRVERLWSPEELKDWYKEVSANDYKFEGREVEGFVISDQSNVTKHWKVKTEYYKFWKDVRGLMQDIRKDRESNRLKHINRDMVIDFDYFYEWLESHVKRFYTLYDREPSVFEVRRSWNIHEYYAEGM